MLSSVFRSTARASARVTTGTRSVSVRSMSNTMAPENTQEHRPVIAMHGIPARYANATYVAASKRGTLEKVEGELAGLAKAATESPAFAAFLENPLIARDTKSAQIEAMLKEKKVSDITVNLCTTLAGNARLADLPRVASTYASLMKAKRGQVDATIISADPLTKKESDQIAAAIKANSQGAKEVVISSQVDPSIMGGIQIQIGDQFLDLSVKSRIEELSRTPV
jgi:F-type H+-transporting ATPase subunit O